MINSIVSSRYGSRYGVVTSVGKCGHRTLVTVHIIDPKTGEKMACPDDRCKGESKGCPIHQFSTDAHELTEWTERDIRFYVGEGLISQAIADAALVPMIKVERNYASYPFKVTMITKKGHGEEVRVERITGESPLVVVARKLLAFGQDDSLGVCTACTMRNPADPDYQAFAALFAD